MAIGRAIRPLLVIETVRPIVYSPPVSITTLTIFIARSEATEYRYRITLPSGQWQELEDPYRFPPLLTAFELHLHGEGTNYESYGTLGAHAITCEE